MSVALVTGASRGIGAATALALARDGHDVLVHYHASKAGAEVTAAEVGKRGRRALLHQADVGDARACEAMVAAAERALGPLDVVVANAGVYERRQLPEVSLELWDRTLRTNLSGAFHTIRPALPGMVARGRGSIVVVSSILGAMGSNQGAHYAASKAGLLGLTKSLAKELAPRGVRVNAVAPGAIETDILRADTPEQRARRLDAIPMRRVGQAEEVAEVIAFLASARASFVTGQVVHANGGQLMP
ncbi:MAG TPA: SDR family NAD(P)-dependent oxidoreductase [Candidatus Thermoplasmatota archaeon]|jgi:3-oxoacyl-[acyl-carrier protein] reductase|nr:SDR family NAD(P)-dependent oxidoreductase [Candidatus Thermoplasmatota archaeon]